MRRLKEGFYLIMKLANTVKDKGQQVKQEIIQFSIDNKIEKPIVEAIITLKTTPWLNMLSEGGTEIKVEIMEETKSGAKGKKKKGPAIAFKKKLMLKLGAADDNGQIEEKKEAPPVIESQQIIESPQQVFETPENVETPIKEAPQIFIPQRQAVLEYVIYSDENQSSHFLPPIVRYTRKESAAMILVSRLKQYSETQPMLHFMSRIRNTQSSQALNLVQKTIRLREKLQRPMLRIGFAKILAISQQKQSQTDVRGALRIAKILISSKDQPRPIEFKKAWLKWKNATLICKQSSVNCANIGKSAICILMKLVMSLTESRNRSLKCGFTTIYENSTQIVLPNMFKQIRENLDIVQEQIKSQNVLSSVKSAKTNALKQKHSDQLQSLNQLQSGFNEVYSLYKLYEQVWNLKSTPIQRIHRNIDNEQSLQQIQAARKLSQILNNQLFVNKAKVRRLRIWQAIGLQEEMKHLCNSLQAMSHKDKKVRLLSIMQGQKLALQRAFYKWVCLSSHNDQQSTPKVSQSLMTSGLFLNNGGTTNSRVRSKTAIALGGVNIQSTAKLTHKQQIASVSINSGIYYGNNGLPQQQQIIQMRSPFNNGNLGSGVSRQYIQNSSSTSNINNAAAASGRRNNNNLRGGSSSSSIDEMGHHQNVVKSTSNSQQSRKQLSKSGSRSGHGSKKPYQKVSMMGSFDFDQQNINTSGIKKSLNHQTSHSSISVGQKQQMSQLKALSKSNNIGQHRVAVSSLSTFLNQQMITIPAGSINPMNDFSLSDSNRKMLRLAYIMIRGSGRSTIQTHIDKLTQISKQSVRHKKSNNNNLSASTTKSTFFTEEIQQLINTSCKQILATFFKKWVQCSLEIGRKQITQVRAVTQIFTSIDTKMKSHKWEVLLKLYKYQLFLKNSAGTVKQRTHLAFKLTQIKAGLICTNLLLKRSFKKLTQRSFLQWKQVSVISYHKHQLLSAYKPAVMTPSSDQIKKQVQMLGVAIGSKQIQNILKGVMSDQKSSMMKAFQKWLIVARQSKIDSKQLIPNIHFNELKKQAASLLFSWLDNPISKRTSIFKAFMNWKKQPTQPSCNNFDNLIKIDENLIQVQSQVAHILEERLDKQLNKEKQMRLEKTLIKLLKVYEDKKDCNPDLLQSRALTKWIDFAELRMPFTKVSKYLYEIDISNNEKKELEVKIHSLNEDNEAMQLKIKEHTLSTRCDDCRQLQLNSALMAVQQQTERRQQAWERYSNNEQQFDSEVQQMEEWNDSIEEPHKMASDHGLQQNFNEQQHSEMLSSESFQDQTNDDCQIMRIDQTESQQEDDQASYIMQGNHGGLVQLDKNLSEQQYLKNYFQNSRVRMNKQFETSSLYDESQTETDVMKLEDFTEEEDQFNHKDEEIEGSLKSIVRKTSDEENKVMGNAVSAQNLKGVCLFRPCHPIQQIGNSNSQKTFLSSIYADDQTIFRAQNDQDMSSEGINRLNSQFDMIFPSRFAKQSESDTIAEEVEAENFGNDLVVALEQENTRLRMKEQEMRRELEMRMDGQQRRREWLMNKIRELETSKGVKSQDMSFNQVVVRTM